MGAQAFKPLGEQPKWQPLYDLMVSRQIGDLLTYAELDRAGGFDVRADRSPLYQAIRKLEVSHHRTFANMPGEGYRMVEAAEHFTLAQKHQRRSWRQIGRARRKIDAADPQLLTPDEIRTFSEYGARLSQAESMIRRLAKKQALLEKRTEVTEAGQATLEQKLSLVVGVLERHGLLKEEHAA